MNKLKETFKNLIKDESGQGATEYILLLVVVIAIATIFKDKIKSFVDSKMSDISGKVGEFQ